MNLFKKMFAIVAAAIMLSSLASAQTKEHAFLWTAADGFQELPTLGGNITEAFAINDSGAVVGFSFLSDNTSYHAFVWTAQGGMVDIGTVGGCCSEAFGINSAGQVVGDSIDASGNDVAFTWSLAGGFQIIGSASNGAASTAVNDLGDVTFTRSNGQRLDSYVWTAGIGQREIPGFSGSTFTDALAINNLRHVVGASSADHLRSFLWTRTGGTLLLPTLGADTNAYSINDQDEVVGLSFLRARLNHAFYWNHADRESIQNLGSLVSNSTALHINNAGEIVGYATGSSGKNHAVMWPDHNSTIMDLGLLTGGTYSLATSVNASGQVVGYGDVQ